MAKKTSSSAAAQRRRHVRFRADPGAFALVDLKPTGREFRPGLVALIVEEAYGGCGVALVNTPEIAGKLKEDDVVKIQVGRQEPMLAEIKWRVDLDAKVVRLGLMYLE